MSERLGGSLGDKDRISAGLMIQSLGGDEAVTQREQVCCLLPLTRTFFFSLCD